MLIKENPFFILDVSLSANRRRIAEATEEMGFMLGQDKCSEAQSILTNPQKRLSAELDWFPGTSDEEIRKIRDFITNGQLINADELSGYSKLNALIYNFSLIKHSDINELGFDIVAIDEQYTGIDLQDIASAINRDRDKAGFPSASVDEIQEYHRSKIEDIRKQVNEELKPYDEKSYVEFVTVLAENYIADKNYNAGEVLADVVDQYEIRMQTVLDDKTNQLKRYIQQIKSENSTDVIKKPFRS